MNDYTHILFRIATALERIADALERAQPSAEDGGQPKKAREASD